LHKLYQSLSEQGLLFIGYAETNFINPEHFNPLGVPHAFVYEKRAKSMMFQSNFANNPKTILPKTPQQSLHKSINHDLHYKKLTASMQILTNNSSNPSKNLTDASHRASNQPNKQINKTTNKAAKKLNLGSTLAKSNQKNAPTKTKILGQELDQGKSERLFYVRQLANQGELNAALAACQQYIKDYQTDAGGYLLLGEIYQALNLDLEAYTAFKKALYLDPECTDSLTHLIFLSEQQRNYEQAERYRQRLQSKTTNSGLD
jgi:chemotaxis protein methyltransferase WspC